LPFIQAAQTSTLDGADVNENVGATTVRLNKSETICRVGLATLPDFAVAFAKASSVAP